MQVLTIDWFLDTSLWKSPVPLAATTYSERGRRSAVNVSQPWVSTNRFDKHGAFQGSGGTIESFSSRGCFEFRECWHSPSEQPGCKVIRSLLSFIDNVSQSSLFLLPFFLPTAWRFRGSCCCLDFFFVGNLRARLCLRAALFLTFLAGVTALFISSPALLLRLLANWV